MAARARARSGRATLRAMTVVRGNELFVAVWTGRVDDEDVGLVCVENVVCVTLPASAAVAAATAFSRQKCLVPFPVGSMSNHSPESCPAVIGIWQYALNSDRAFDSSVGALAWHAVRTCRPINESYSDELDEQKQANDVILPPSPQPKAILRTIVETLGSAHFPSEL